MLWDTHMHCSFSGDSQADPGDMVTAALAKGLLGICFTDHMDYDYRETPGEFDLDVDGYRDRIQKLQEENPDFPILWGVELGLQPHTAEKNIALAQKYPFDFIIGSSHCVRNIDVYYPNFYEGRSEDAAYREYFEAVLANVNGPSDYDVYGHIDYVVRYGPNKNAFYSYAKFADILDEILRQIIAQGKGIEINTAGFKYGLGHPNPTEDILRRYRELGGEILTIGADAHKPEHVAYAFDKVPDILKASGFRYYTVFRKREPHFVELP